MGDYSAGGGWSLGSGWSLSRRWVVARQAVGDRSAGSWCVITVLRLGVAQCCATILEAGKADQVCPSHQFPTYDPVMWTVAQIANNNLSCLIALWS